MIWYDETFDATPLWRNMTVLPEIMDYLWGKLFREMDITKEADELTQPNLFD